MQAHLGHTVAVEVTGEGLVAGIAEQEREIGGTEATFVLTELVDDVEGLLGGPVDRQGVTPVTVEVSRNGDVGRISEEEPDVRDALRIAVSQVRKGIRLSEQARRCDTVAVPVPHEGDVPGIAVVERLRRVPVPDVPLPRLRIHEADRVAGHRRYRSHDEGQQHTERGEGASAHWGLPFPLLRTYTPDPRCAQEFRNNPILYIRSTTA